jgi:YbgC/YbaW family acyl-CoA thioester hydrolase
MPTLFRTTRRIEFADTDMAGIVHFSNFFRFMEAAEVEFLRSRGLSVKVAWEGRQLGFPRVAASCDYTRPARFEDLLEVLVSLHHLGRKSVTYAFEFCKDGTRIAQGKLTSCCCLVHADHQLEAVEIPATLRAILEQSAPV